VGFLRPGAISGQDRRILETTKAAFKRLVRILVGFSGWGGRLVNRAVDDTCALYDYLF
jgi:hypothetical protein